MLYMYFDVRYLIAYLIFDESRGIKIKMLIEKENIYEIP